MLTSTRRLLLLSATMAHCSVAALAQGGVAWNQAGPVHSASAKGPMAYDAARQEVVMVVGQDTWTWRGVDWTRQTP
jgi:hypothetical protein